MANATNLQVQQFVDQRTRPRCESLRDLLVQMAADKASVDDVYNALQTPTWTDTRTDGPPHLALPSDVLAWNTVISNLIAILNGTLADQISKAQAVDAVSGQMPIVQKLCVRPPLG